MKAFRKYILCPLLLCAWSMGLSAQSDPCLSYLKDAQQKTNEGKFDESIALAHKALSDCDFSKNDIIEAQKLLILNYLNIDNIEAAELAAAKVMKLNPTHEADRLRDPAEVIAIFNKYRPAPVFAAFIHGGINRTNIEVMQTYSIVGENNAEGLANYERELGWQIGAGLEHRIWKNLWGVADAQYRSSGYSITLDDVQGAQVNYSERIGLIDFNAGGRYYIGSKRLQGYAEGGIQLSFLISALGDISRDNQSDIEGNISIEQQADIVDRSIQRNSVFNAPWLGAGISWQQKGLRFQLGARYTGYAGNVVDAENRFANLDIIFKYYYLDNDFSMNNVQLRGSVVYVLRYKNMLDTNQKR